MSHFIPHHLASIKLSVSSLGGNIWFFAVGFFYADIFNLVEHEVPGEPRFPAWNVAGIIMRPDGSVTVTSRTYEWATGLDVSAGGPEDGAQAVCDLGAGVYFYKYP